jgi:CubicO group peptidase (beta-lactamase class C family)
MVPSRPERNWCPRVCCPGSRWLSHSSISDDRNSSATSIVALGRLDAARVIVLRRSTSASGHGRTEKRPGRHGYLASGQPAATDQLSWILGDGWISESTAAHIGPADRLLFYGYQWWQGRSLFNGRDMPFVVAIGNGGQRILIVPGLDLVAVITAGHYASPTQVWLPLLSLTATFWEL